MGAAMSAALVPLDFEGQGVRVIDRAGDPWFVAGDASKILAYRDAEKLTRLLDDDEKGTHIVGTLGGPQEMSVISEAGLYRAIVQRRASEDLSPEKRDAIARFQRWLFHEVLPSIRRTGSYSAPAPSRPVLPKDVASAFRSFASIGKLIGLDRNQAAIAANQATLKTTGVDALALMGTTHLTAPQQERILTPTQIGQEMRPEAPMSARAVNLLLEARGYQVSKPSGWDATEKGLPFAHFSDTGKRHGDGTPIRQMRWIASMLHKLAGPEEEAA